MEKKLISNKSLPWTRANVVGNVLVYVLNSFLMVALLLLGAYITNKHTLGGFEEFLRNWSRIINFYVLIVFMFVAIFMYFYYENKDFLKFAVNSEMIFLILELVFVVCFLMGKYINVYVRPVALAAILILFLTDSKTAIFINLIFSIILFLFDVFMGSEYFGMTQLETVDYNLIYFIVISVVSGTIAAYLMREVFSRIRLLTYSLIVSLPVMAGIALPILEFGGNNIWLALLSGLASGPLAAGLFIIFLPIFEVMFNKTSSFKLNELTSHRSKVISTLIEQAPGTFNHAIVVSNIAEAAATAIGEDALLARTCAYYHDIGKLRRPEFFKENQADGVNPHDDLTPELSANIIKSHTDDGYKLAIKNRIPIEIADVIREHHGTMPIVYFYDKAKKFTDGEVSINQYCYAGPKPQSKIAAIIMIADGSEAASRSLADRSKESVERVVHKLVNERMELGQFDECEITLKELNIIMNAVVNSLTGVYHNRIEYPKLSLKSLGISENGEIEEPEQKPRRRATRKKS